MSLMLNTDLEKIPIQHLDMELTKLGLAQTSATWQWSELFHPLRPSDIHITIFWVIVNFGTEANLTTELGIAFLFQTGN